MSVSERVAEKEGELKVMKFEGGEDEESLRK